MIVSRLRVADPTINHPPSLSGGGLPSAFMLGRKKTAPPALDSGPSRCLLGKSFQRWRPFSFPTTCPLVCRLVFFLPWSIIYFMPTPTPGIESTEELIDQDIVRANETMQWVQEMVTLAKELQRRARDLQQQARELRFTSTDLRRRTHRSN